jgi:Flp pilus assembly protein TadD
MGRLRLIRFPVKVILAAAFGIGSILLMGGATVLQSTGQMQAAIEAAPAGIVIDYPLNGSVFPPDITSPTFLWRDPRGAVQRWVVEVSFPDRSQGFRVEATAEHLQMGEIDPQVSGPIPLTAEQTATRTWKPDSATWAKIKGGSVDSPATITISGFAGNSSTLPVSRGTVTISTSRDPVGAPIFYRDVPLMTVPHTEKGSIQPLPTSALPLIKWRVRDISQPQSRVVMEKLHSCANCHSFSMDGKTMGLDVDGPRNDKGLYALVPVAKSMAIRNQDVIRWSSFQEDLGEKSSDPALKRFGFMSQISPDGRYVVTSIGPPNLGNTHQDKTPGFAPGLSDRLFNANYNHLGFNQVFYPTRGILAWYDRKEKKLRPLPGADDPRYVQTSAFWSPDEKYLIFSRAEARDPYPPGSKKPEYANDPNETQIQYDLYRIPFNEGRGGKAEPVVGASANGMSNSFPKVSPDGRWIVFVENRNGLLMRPDSKLYIVPFRGGKARLMNCNLSLMNSWHSFSPDGHWLAFSSKGRSIYTQLMLTHIDANGNDTPAVLVENTTAANRAVNIPEFVNTSTDNLQQIDPQAAEVYRVADKGFELMGNKQMAEAVPEWRKAVEMDPDDANWHFNLGVSLWQSGHEAEGAEEFGKTCDLNPNEEQWYAHLTAELSQTGDLDAAAVKLDIPCYRKSLSLNPSDAKTEAALGVALFRDGQAVEGYEHLQKAVALAPDFADGHNELATALAKMGRVDDAVVEVQKAIALTPSSAEYRYNRGFALELRGDLIGAVASFQQSVELSAGKDARCLAALAAAYDKAGRFPEAVEAARHAIDLAAGQHDQEREQKLRHALEQYQRDASTTQP